MIRVERLTGDALARALPEVARLRIAVFRAFPYLYDGDAAYEERYLQVYRESEDAILVGAYDGARLVGAATGTPMEDHAGDFGAAFAGTMDLTILLGVALLFTGRFYPAVGIHMVFMVLGAAVAHIVPAVMKRRAPEDRTFAPYVVGTAVALALVVTGITMLGRPIVGG